MTASVIDLEDVTVLRGARRIVDGVTLALGAAEVAALVGPSGAGKSTLARAILGLEPLSRGRIRIHGELATDGPRVVVPSERRGLSVVFQDLALWPHLSAAGNLDFVLAARGVPRAERRRRTAEALAQVGLESLAARKPHQLSGGEQQRVAIARALVTRPLAVILDEPLTALDVVLRRDVLALCASLFEEHATAALYITHDPREVGALARRLLVLEDGELVQDGDLATVAATPATAFAAAIARELA